MAANHLNAAFPSGPMLEDSGELSTAWRGFFMALYARTGGSTGVSTSGIPADLAAEAAAREAADTALQGNIDAEASARASGDTANANAIVAEQTQRIAGDANLQRSLNVLHLAGYGAPTASAAIGTVYSRRDGTVGLRLYVSAGGGAWSPMAEETGAPFALSGTETGDNATGFLRAGDSLVMEINGADARYLQPAGADARYLSLAVGGIVAGPVQFLTPPILATDAVTKGFVDQAIAGVTTPTALRTLAYTPNEIMLDAFGSFFLDVNFPVPVGGGLRNILVIIDPVFASNDPPGSAPWQVIYSTNLIGLQSTVVAYKFTNDPTSMIRAPARFTAAIDATPGTVRVLLNARVIGGGTLIQVGVGGTIAPELRTIVTVQDLGPV